jgi:hypothetical protein
MTRPDQDRFGSERDTRPLLRPRRYRPSFVAPELDDGGHGVDPWLDSLLPRQCPGCGAIWKPSASDGQPDNQWYCSEDCVGRHLLANQPIDPELQHGAELRQIHLDEGAPDDQTSD